MSQIEIKYVVASGHTVSRTDGQLHYVSAESLIALYRVDRRECVVYHCLTPDALYEGLTVLRPRYDGDYRHPSEYPQKT